MRLLVTGGTGFIGRHLTTHLLTQGHAVSLLVREQYGMGMLLPAVLQPHRSDLHLVYADLRNYNQVYNAVKEARPERVIHLAGIGTTDPFMPLRTALRYNLDGVINLAEACFKHSHATDKIKRLVVARTPGEETRMNVYAVSKLAGWNVCEMYARTGNWPIVGATIFQAYGIGQADHTFVPSAFTAAINNDNFPMTSGTQKRDWVYVDDVVRGLLAITQADIPAGTSLDIGTGTMTALCDVVRMIYDIVGGEGRPLIGALPNRPGEAPCQQAKVAECEQQSGFHATVHLRDGLHNYYAQTESFTGVK